MKKLEEELLMKKKKDTEKQKQPYCCPVCNGRGAVLGGFYGGSASTVGLSFEETCRSCKGTGVIWN